jgi:hypothetical protein
MSRPVGRFLILLGLALFAGLGFSGLSKYAVAADGQSSSGTEAECIEPGLAAPQVSTPIVMHHAGLRPLTPRHYHSQGTTGWFQVAPLPEGCTTSIIRTVVGQVQMQKRSDRSVWINVGFNNGNINWKSNEIFELASGPTHAWPDYLFNECVGGKGWLKVRGVLVVKVKDSVTRQVVGERRYTYPAEVHGSCQLARYSKKATAHYQEEWGGSGSESYRRAVAGRASDDACIQAVLAKPQRVDRADVVNAGRHPYERSPRTPGRVQTATIQLTYRLIAEDCTEAVERVVHIRIEKQIGPDLRWHRLKPGYNWTETVAVNNPYPVALAVEFPVNESYKDRYYWHPGEGFRALIEVDAVDRSSRALLDKRDEYVSLRILSHK